MQEFPALNIYAKSFTNYYGTRPADRAISKNQFELNNINGAWPIYSECVFIKVMLIKFVLEVKNASNFLNMIILIRFLSARQTTRMRDTTTIRGNLRNHPRY